MRLAAQQHPRGAVERISAGECQWRGNQGLPHHRLDFRRAETVQRIGQQIEGVEAVADGDAAEAFMAVADAGVEVDGDVAGGWQVGVGGAL